MATLVFTAIGTALGGPIGGAIGALVGQQIDLAVLNPQARQGPRLKDLAVQSSSYGVPLPRHYGRMRAAGSVIWATDLQERREKSGGGKGKPKVVTYSYSCSFAVALASRPIRGIGKVWADGNLLRGAEGDLKSAGELRVHDGHGDQDRDPLLAAAEGADRCPAYRGTAYAVFEDLALAEFGNRIPSLSFEIIADDGTLTLGGVLADVLTEATVSGVEDTVAGYSIEAGDGAGLVETIAALAPLTCVTAGPALRIEGATTDAVSTPLPEPLLDQSDGGAAQPACEVQRESAPQAPDIALRYYDIDRDFQPGVQRGAGRSGAGVSRTFEFAAALAAGKARSLADALTRRAAVAMETARCRIASADARFAPGRSVVVTGEVGSWQVESWELGHAGIELGLRRLPRSPEATAVTDPGRANLPPDLMGAPTVLAAFELPWDGVGSANDRRVFAAVSSASAGWAGAQLFVERADGSLDPLGVSGRGRAVMGFAASVLAAGPGTIADLAATVDVDLMSSDFALTSAAPAQLAAGGNRALLGSEVIQFAAATALGGGRWRLRGLLRGRGGTEWAIAVHALGEPFVLIDDAILALDAAAIGDPSHVRVAAIGLGDDEPVSVAVGLPGVSLLPPSPVHGKITAVAGGGVALGWTRRARGAWLWREGADAPLVEQSEAYVVSYGDIAAPLAQWSATSPTLELDATDVAALEALSPDAVFAVRQLGDHGYSRPLVVGPLP